ncbi:MAG: hypothetical protein HGA80_02830 [Candidatus Omnitrophica bacterium]|nr:hypothetical protein [Candidatus Omnitrophota bacterium]
MAKRIFLLSAVMGVLMLTGCETIHTGILGDVPTGMAPSGALKLSEIYQDPTGRFSATVSDSHNLVARRTPEGVVLEGKEVDRGDILYGVLVYDVPAAMSGSDREILQATWDGMVRKAQGMRAGLHLVDSKESDWNGLPCLQLYYRSEVGDCERSGCSKRAYVGRLVKKGARVYNIYFSYYSVYQSAFDKELYTSPKEFEAMQPRAEAFWQGVSLE